MSTPSDMLRSTWNAIIDEYYPRGEDGWRRPNSGPLAGCPLMYDGPMSAWPPTPAWSSNSIGLARITKAGAE